MPIRSIADDILPNDIHVVRGNSVAGQTSQDLRDLLRVTPAAGGDQTTYLDYLQSHNDVAILFTPLFKAQAETATEFQGFGITVNKSTGRVTAKGKAPATAPATFIVEATVTKNTGGPNGIPPAFLRVHVHQTVVRVTVTPKRLSTRAAPGSDLTVVSRAFTARAEFDDGTVADVTTSDQVTFLPTTHFDGPW